MGRNGTTLVLSHGPKYEVLAANVLDDNFDASPVIAGNELYCAGIGFCIVLPGNKAETCRAEKKENREDRKAAVLSFFRRTYCAGVAHPI